MPLSPAEQAAFREIERQLADVDRARQKGRTRPVLLVAWATGVLALVIGGVGAGNAAAVILGLSWAMAVVLAWWALHRFEHYL
jgi:hypothetical protein